MAPIICAGFPPACIIDKYVCFPTAACGTGCFGIMQAKRTKKKSSPQPKVAVYHCYSDKHHLIWNISGDLRKINQHIINAPLFSFLHIFLFAGCALSKGWFSSGGVWMMFVAITSHVFSSRLQPEQAALPPFPGNHVCFFPTLKLSLVSLGQMAHPLPSDFPTLRKLLGCSGSASFPSPDHIFLPSTGDCDHFYDDFALVCSSFLYPYLSLTVI